MSATHNIEAAHVSAADELLDVLTAMAKCLLEQQVAAGADSTGDDGKNASRDRSVKGV